MHPPRTTSIFPTRYHPRRSRRAVAFALAPVVVVVVVATTIVPRLFWMGAKVGRARAFCPCQIRDVPIRARDQ